jgi:plastocyanin
LSRLRLVAAAVVAVTLTGGCDSDRRAISRDDLPDVSDEPTVEVDIADTGFEPDAIEITTEDLVAFENTGDEDHGIRTEDFRIDTGLLFPGESTFVIFDEPGSYTVVDVADDDHTMTVVATAPDS